MMTLQSDDCARVAEGFELQTGLNYEQILVTWFSLRGISEAG